MMNGGVSSVFLDTNILVYATAPSSAFHFAAVAAIQRYSDMGAALWISRQIVREYLAVVTRPQSYAHPIPAQEAIARVAYLLSQFRIAEDTPQVTANLLALMAQIPLGGKQVHDANIVATMQAYNIRRLLTHNMADFQRFSPLVMLLPLQQP